MSKMSSFANTIFQQKYAYTYPDGKKETEWYQLATRVASNVVLYNNSIKDESIKTGIFENVEELISDLTFVPGGRYCYAAGRDFHQTQNCLLLRADDNREGWSDLLHKASMALMTGAGVGIDYSDVREKGAIIRRTGGFATGPIALMKMVNECGRGIQQGGSRRSALWAGLRWNHPDIFEFIHLKDWPDYIVEAKKRDFNAYAPMDGTNISVILDDEFFFAYYYSKHVYHGLAHRVYWEVISQMLKTGEPGFSIDVGSNAGESLRNACTEITSYDDSDICNLGSINMSKIKNLHQMSFATEAATQFLFLGTTYSHVPYDKVDKIRTKNRRLGLGLMGLHEFLITRGMSYEMTPELRKYLEVYQKVSRKSANDMAKLTGLSCPVKVRAIAPTGTIGIVAETTTGIEPIFCVAYKRRYLEGTTWKYQYVIDPTAKRLIDSGIKPEDIEDAYVLANNVEKRVKFQADLQEYVDHGISSTINLPAWGTSLNNEERIKPFGNMLLEYLPRLRGITVYPDGSRGGQPYNPVPYREAIDKVGEVFFESTDICDLTKAGSCGS